MPPSKKKSLRGPFSPAIHLHNNPHSDPKSVIEQLFLLRRFEEALELSHGILLELCNRDEDEDRLHKNKQPMQVNDEFAEPQDKIMHLTHTCKDSELCECSKIVVLVIQIMYEMGKATLATPFACKFYRDVKCVPYDIVFVCANLLVNSLSNFPEAKRILTTTLDLCKINQQGLVTSPPSKVVVHTPEQREILMEFLLFHVMAPLNDIQEAIDILARDKSISPQKKEGWTSCLDEIQKANLLKAQQQQQQQQQSQQKSPQTQSPPQKNNIPSPSLSSNNNTPNSPNQVSASPSSSSPSVSSPPSTSTIALNYCKSLVATSKRTSAQLWAYIRKLAQSKFGTAAFGIAVVWLIIHLFTSFRRRVASPSNLIEDIEDDRDNITTRRNTETRRKTNTNNNNNTNRTKQTTTKAKAPKAQQRQQQHYGGVDQIEGGGIWSSVRELMSTALSLK